MIVGTTDEKACPVNRVINLFGRKWVFGILKDIFMGKTHFTQFKEDKPELSNVVLMDTLKFLEKEEIIYKKTDKENKKPEYHLTDKGKKTNKILYEMVIYGLYVLEADKRNENLKTQIATEYKEILKIEEK